MANLITLETLAKWTQNDTAEVSADPFAIELIDKVSRLVSWLGGHDGSHVDADGNVIPEWTLDPGADRVPINIEMIVLQICKRSYENPTQVIQEGSIGPIGGDRHADDYALFMSLTDKERESIVFYNPDGDPEPTEGAGSVFAVPITRGEESLLRPVTLYVGDNLQTGLSTSADPREWKVPLFNPGDPGDPNRYLDE